MPWNGGAELRAFTVADSCTYQIPRCAYQCSPKGGLSSRRLNRLLRPHCCLCVALDLLPLWAWVESRLNPADEPSRRYEPSDQATDDKEQ